MSRNPVRIIRNGFLNGVLQGRDERAMEAIKNLTEGIDAETIRYLVEHGVSLWSLWPKAASQMLRPWLSMYFWMASLTPDDLLNIAKAARPDCASVLDSEAGRSWLSSLLVIFKGG